MSEKVIFFDRVHIIITNRERGMLKYPPCATDLKYSIIQHINHNKELEKHGRKA